MWISVLNKFDQMRKVKNNQLIYNNYIVSKNGRKWWMKIPGNGQDHFIAARIVFLFPRLETFEQKDEIKDLSMKPAKC